MTQPRRQFSRLSLVQRFSIRAFVVIFLFAAIFATVFASTFRHFGEKWEQTLTEEHILREIRNGFPVRFFEEPQAFSREESAEFPLNAFLFGHFFRVKFWDTDMTVIWSDEERLIGQRFPDNQRLARALTGELTSEIHRPRQRDNQYEEGLASEVMEFYVPVEHPENGRIVGVIEVYRNAEEFLADLRSATWLIWGVTLAGAVVLFLALVGIVKGGQKEQERLEGNLTETSNDLEEERQKLACILNGVEAGLLLVDRDHKIRWANEIANAWFRDGAPLEGRVCGEAIWGSKDDCSNCPTDQIFSGHPFRSCERFVKQGRNQGRYFEVFSSPIRDDLGETKMAVQLIQDVTERKTLEARLVQAGQLAAVGELAAKVAHEVNNPVGIIGSLSKLLLSRSSDLDLPDEVRSDLEKISNSADRIARVTTDLLSFSRPPSGEMTAVSLGVVVRDSLGLTGHSLTSGKVRIERDIPADLPPVMGHESRLGQVVLNLVKNAVDAMPDGGRLVISGETVEANGDTRVLLRFADSGSGIPVDLRPVIFDPFITTKRTGSGTGLGLSVTRDILEDHGGTIRIERTSEEGTTFLITFPAAPRS